MKRTRGARRALLLTVAFSAPAMAQDATDEARTDGREIVVVATGLTEATSATKAGTPVIEAVQTISVISREEMDVRAVSTVSDALAYTAGVNVESSGIDSRTDEIVVRGFGAGGFSSNNNFVDGLRLPSGGQWTRTQFDPFALQQLEVMKGPSSVLYGQTAPGGIINMVTKRPTTEFSGEVMLQAAGFTDLGRWQFQAAGDVGGALNSSGTLSARLVGLVREGDTQVKETSNSRYYISPSITWAPTSDVSWTVLGQYQRDEGGSTYQFLPMTGTLVPSNGRRIALDEYLGEPDWNVFDRDQILVASFFRANLNDHVTFRNNVRYTHLSSLYRVTVLSGDTLTPAQCTQRVALYPAAYTGCIGGQTIGRRAVQGDGEADGIAIDNNLQAKFTTGSIEHTLLGGIDYFYTDWEHYRDLVTLTGVPRGEVEPLLDMFDPVPRGSSHYAANLQPQIYTETESDQVGLYLQNQMKIGNLRLTLGGRQDWAQDVTVNAVTGTRFTTKSSDFTWQAGAVYLFDNGLAPYASYSESFQPMVSDPASNLGGEPFDPTTGQQYEAGLRFQPSNGRSYFTLGGYQITQQNVVTPAPSPAAGIPAPMCGTSVCNVQTGEIRVRGIEFEARAATDIGVTVVGSATRAWTKVIESNSPAELGNKAIQMPDWMASAFVDYRFPEGSLRGVGLGGGIRYTGKTWGDIANTLRIPDHTLFDLFLRYDFGLSNPSLDGLSVSLNARNLTDKTYVSTCASVAACYYGSGRTVTARAQYRW